MQRVFAFQGVGLARCWRPVEGFVVSKHIAIGLPPSSICCLLSFANNKGVVNGRSAVSCALCRAMHGTEGWRESRSLVSSIIVFHATNNL